MPSPTCRAPTTGWKACSVLTATASGALPARRFGFLGDRGAWPGPPGRLGDLTPRTARRQRSGRGRSDPLASDARRHRSTPPATNQRKPLQTRSGSLFAQAELDTPLPVACRSGKKDPYWLRVLTIIVLALLAWAFLVLVAFLLWEAGKFLIMAGFAAGQPHRRSSTSSPLNHLLSLSPLPVTGNPLIYL